MRYLTVPIICLLVIVFAYAQEPTNSQMTLPLQEHLSSVNQEYQILVADWMISIGRQHLAEKRIRNRLKQDAIFKQAFQDYVVDCCEYAFSPNGKRAIHPSVVEGNPEWAAGLLVLQVPRDILLSAIVPHLCPGKRLHGILEGKDRDLARYLEYQADISDPICFIAYIKYLREHKQMQPVGLIAYMIRRCPEKALPCLIDVFSDSLNNVKDLLWAEHVIANTLWKHNNGHVEKNESDMDSTTQLKMLSKSTQWWIRLYVAEIMRQHYAFRQSEIIERLKKDEHPLVRKTIEELSESTDKAAGEAKNQSSEP